MADNIIFNRLVTLDKFTSSCFIFGPRMTGKSFLLSGLKHDGFYNLLDAEQEIRLRKNPKAFWEEVSGLKPHSTIIIDEIQRIPPLLDYVLIRKRSGPLFSKRSGHPLVQ